jgi:hypothetical protein
MDCSTSENESLSEVETLKQQLATYKLINIHLSKRIQELKVELNNFKQENAKIKTELFEESAKRVQYRNYFIRISRQCMDFVNASDMQQINENDSTLVEEVQVSNNG